MKKIVLLSVLLAFCFYGAYGDFEAPSENDSPDNSPQWVPTRITITLYKVYVKNDYNAVGSGDWTFWIHAEVNTTSYDVQTQEYEVDDESYRDITDASITIETTGYAKVSWYFKGGEHDPWGWDYLKSTGSFSTYPLELCNPATTDFYECWDEGNNVKYYFKVERKPIVKYGQLVVGIKGISQRVYIWIDGNSYGVDPGTKIGFYLTEGTYIITFEKVTGYQEPPPQIVTIHGGECKEIIGEYRPVGAPPAPPPDTTPPVSSVNPIEPYWQLKSPWTVSVAVSEDLSGISKVELYYRYSVDNSTWSNWICYGSKSSPPWSWEFTTETQGYYEFCSIATD